MKLLKPLIWISLAVLPLLYFNCAKTNQLSSPASGNTGTGGGGDPGTPSAALNSFQVLSDGTIQVWADKELNFSPTDGQTGVYTISGLPSWATFEVSTGHVRGVPRRLADTGTFTITKVGGSSYGPYKITIVSDSYKEQQWHLINTGQNAFAFTSGVPDQDIHYKESVKNNILGVGVRIAVSDSGAYIAHPDLTENVLAGQSRNYNNNYLSTGSWIGDPTPAAANPGDAHGTAVTGLAVAKGWNGIGTRGVAPEARFAAFLFLPAQDKLAQSGLTSFALNDQFAGAFDVFNFSWGDPQCFLTEYEQSYVDKLAAGVASQRGGKGSVYLIAAGNSYITDLNDCYNVAPGTDYVLGNANFSELNTTPYSINVAAVAANGVAASYSTPGSNVWISAPGGEYGWSTQAASPELYQPALLTTDYPGCSNGLSSLDKANSTFDNGSNNPNCMYVNTMNGTSGATPVASGAVAMLLQANPNLSWRDVKYILAKTAEKVDANAAATPHPDRASNLAGHTYEMGWIRNAAGFNFHNWYGFGRVHVDNAVSLAKNYSSPLGPFRSTAWKHDSGRVDAAIPDGAAAGLVRSMNVADALTIEAVQLRVSVSACAGDIGLELTSPRGTKSILMNVNSRLIDGALQNHVFLSNAFYGEPSAGSWQLKVIDGRAGCNNAQLTNWKLNFYGY